jgi:hypothetical protein
MEIVMFWAYPTRPIALADALIHRLSDLFTAAGFTCPGAVMFSIQNRGPGILYVSVGDAESPPADVAEMYKLTVDQLGNFNASLDRVYVWGSAALDMVVTPHIGSAGN